MMHVPILNARGWQSPEEVWEWMSRENVKAVYVDFELRMFEPLAWSAIQKQVGVGLEIGFDGTESVPAEAAVLVLLRTEPR